MRHFLLFVAFLFAVTPLHAATVTKSVTVIVSAPVVSQSGTTIPASPSITDFTGVVWTLVGGQAARNGAVDQATSGITLLLYYNGVVYQQTAMGWWSWTAGAWVPVSGDPRSAPLALVFTPAAPTIACTAAPGTAVLSISTTGGNGAAIGYAISGDTVDFALSGARIVVAPTGITAANCGKTPVVTITATQP